MLWLIIFVLVALVKKKINRCLLYHKHAILSAELQHSSPPRVYISRCSRTSISPCVESVATKVKTTRSVKVVGTPFLLMCPVYLQSPPHLPLECLYAPFPLPALPASPSSIRASTAWRQGGELHTPKRPWTHRHALPVVVCCPPTTAPSWPWGRSSLWPSSMNSMTPVSLDQYFVYMKSFPLPPRSTYVLCLFVVVLSSDEDDEADSSSTGSVNRLDSVSPRPADSAHSSPVPSSGRVEAAVKEVAEHEEHTSEFFNDVDHRSMVPRKNRLKDPVSSVSCLALLRILLPMFVFSQSLSSLAN